MHELIKETEELLERIRTAMRQLDINKLKAEVTGQATAMAQPDFWDNPQEAAQISQEHSHNADRVVAWESLESQAKEVIELAKLDDHKLLPELQDQYEVTKRAFEAREFELKLNGEYDKRNAILRIHAGTGGTDAQDWAQMLQRMYLRYGDSHGFKVELLDESPGEEAGIKSATLSLGGEYAYGRLKSEHGVHRLVRLSPFNSDNLRQTSFALVEVLPEIPENDTVVLDEKDLKIDVYRSGGSGGQSVNTTDSAVRITHIATGITVSIQNERSQIQNRETAMKILRSRLAQLQEEQRRETIAELKGPSHTEQWGKQIRNYVLHPYTLVKDTRTGEEKTDVAKVLDGDLDDFIDAYLTSQLGNSG